MNTTLRAICFASITALAGLSQYDYSSEDNSGGSSENNSTEDTIRVSKDEFLQAHPEHEDVNFSSVGKLTHSGLTCSAVLLKGGLIATASHCIDKAKPETAYSFVAYDSEGQEYKMQVPLHGDAFYENLHLPTQHYFSSVTVTDTDKFHYGNTLQNKATDIALIEYHGDIPAAIDPARVAGPPEGNLREVFALGYSQHVRNNNGSNDTGLSISKQECYSALDYQSYEFHVSSCYTDSGDSGGVYATIHNDSLFVSSTHHTVAKNGHNILDFLHMKIKENGFSHNFQKAAIGTPLYKLSEFCRQQIGDEHCAAFPPIRRRAEAPRPNG